MKLRIDKVRKGDRLKVIKITLGVRNEFNPERKIRYVQITSEILEKEGIEGVTIRKVAEKAGCTSAVLYKHFENKEHLVMLASVKFLEPYIIEFLKQTDREDKASGKMDLWLWRCFIFAAFRNKPYYRMFLGSAGHAEDVYEFIRCFRWIPYRHPCSYV